jgi:hypothetical protein
LEATIGSRILEATMIANPEDDGIGAIIQFILQMLFG